MIIFDLDGRKIYESILQTKDNSIDINVGSFRNGVYLMKIYSEDELIKIEKFAIVK